MLEAGVEGARWLAEQLRKPSPEYGVYNIIGTHNQDRSLIVPELSLNRYGIQSIYGVIDGHGKKGEHAAEHIVRRLPEIIINGENVLNPLIESYRVTHQEILEQFGDSPGAVGAVLCGVEQGMDSYWSGLYVGDPTILVKPPGGVWKWPDGINQQDARFTRAERHLHKQEVALKRRKRWVAMRNCWGHSDLDDIVNRAPKSLLLPREWDIILASDSVGERLGHISYKLGLSLDEVMRHVIGNQQDAASQAKAIAEFTRIEEDARVARESEEVVLRKRVSVHGQDDITVIYLPKK